MFERLMELVATHRVVKIEGPNGSGKSTLLQQYEQTLFASGIRFGILSQHDLGFEELTTKELLDIAARKGCRDLLERLTPGFDSAKTIAVLSSGERTKIMLALALSFEIVLLDEPLSHLDIQSRRLLEELVAESSSRFVIANHEAGAFAQAATLRLGPDESR